MSKKSIIAIITIIVLLFAAGLSVGIFLSGRGETEATDGNQVETVIINPDSRDEEKKVPDEGIVEDNEVANNQEDTQNENVENETTQNETGNNNIANNNTGVTTGTNVDEIGETTITRVQEQERLVSKDFWDWWEPAEVNVVATTPNMKIVTPDIGVEKRVIKTETGDLNLTYVNQEITYEIKITNNTEKDLNNIEVKDRIPEDTTFVSVDDNGTPVTQQTESGEEIVAGVKWILSISGHKEDEEPNFVTVKFTVKVNDKKIIETEEGKFEEVDIEGTITNKAIANGEESNETKTSIIKTRKSSIINNDETVQIAKKGDLITYTITAINTGTETGNVNISDIVPEGTTLISAEGLEIEEGQTAVEWKQVELPAGEEITRQFVVIVDEINREVRNMAIVSDKETNEDVIKTAAIDVEKTIARIKRVVQGLDTYLNLEDKNLAVIEGDVIEYQITVTNIGSEDLTNVLLEEKLKDVVITGLKVAVDGKPEQEKALEYKEENDGTKKLKIGYLNASKGETEEQPAVPAGVAIITATYTVTHANSIYQNPSQLIKNEVIATGETIPDTGKEPIIVDDKDDAEVPVASAPGMTVVKTATKVKKVGESSYTNITEKVRPGDVVEYTITVTNTGNTTLTNINVTDTLDVRVDSDDVKIPLITAGNVIKTIASLSPKDEHVIIKTYYTVNQSDMTDSEIINNVAIGLADGGITDNDDEIVPVNPNITLSGNKIWVLPAEQDLQVPIPTITVRLYLGTQPYKDNGEDVKTVITPVQGQTTYYYSFGNLPKYTAILENGEIKYTENNYSVKEDEVVGFNVKYDDTITKNGNNWTQNITNTSKQTKITFKVDKKWIDEGTTEAINKRPQVKVQLYKNGSAYGNSIVLVKDKCEIQGLEKYAITTAADGKITYKENIYTVQELPVDGYELYSTTNVTNTTTTFTNIIKQGTTSIEATKIWDLPTDIKITDATPITIFVKQNNIRMTGTDKSVTLTYSGTKEQSYTFNNLPKYQEVNGKLVVENGKVKLNNYSVEEEINPQYISTQRGNTIKNTAYGIVEEITTEITNTSTSSPVDVVFVLDVSNSMKNNDRITKMKDAVNSSINTILNYNNSNRVGIVAFTSNSKKVKAKPIKSLNNDKNVEVAYDSTFVEDGTTKGVLYACSCGKTVTQCSCDKATGLTVMGATYTQTGIEKGAQMLINDTSMDKTGRTPIMILMTDGEPTVYNTNYTNIGSADGMNDSPINYSNANTVYYTILTANYWKSEVAKKYHGLANIYTVGIELDSNAAYATLQPTKTNIEKYSTTVRNWLKNNHGYDFNADANVANYADGAYLTNNLTTAELTNKLNSFVNNSKKFKETSEWRLIKASEITSREVKLTKVDTTKTFAITCENGSFTLDTALNAGIVVPNGTDSYKVNLQKVGLKSQLYIKYHKK